MRLAEELRWHRAIAYCLHWLGDVARARGDRQLARSYLAQSRQYLERFNDRARLALILKSEALLEATEGNQGSAMRKAQEASEELAKLGLWREIAELERLIYDVKRASTQGGP